MVKLPVNLIARYTAFLVANGIDTKQHRFYLKWLRFYLDFCTKYSFNWSEFDSLPAFLIKLKSKNQQPSLVDQAKKAVGLFWAMGKTKGTNHVKVVKAPEKLNRSYKNKPSKEVRNESKLSAPSHGASKIKHSSKSVEK